MYFFSACDLGGRLGCCASALVVSRTPIADAMAIAFMNTSEASRIGRLGERILRSDPHDFREGLRMIEYREMSEPNKIAKHVPVIDTFRGKATARMREGGLSNWALSMDLVWLKPRNHPQTPPLF